MKSYYLLMLLLLSSLKSLPQEKQIREAYKKQISKTLKKKNIAGATVAVVSSEGILWIDNFGYADLEKNLPVTEETIFGLGSVTKVFTSTAVMQLAERGHINLDNPLNEYLPAFQMMDDCSGVTPRNVLTHHSGLPSDIFRGMFNQQPEDYKQVVNYMNQEYMAGIADQIRAYSNSGYTLLGHMIAEVSKTEYQEYINQNILQPLNMQNTGFNDLDNASKTYDGKGNAQPDAYLRDIPAGGLFSSSKDMAKFLQAYLSQSQQLLKKATFNEVLEKQHQDAALNFSNEYALGWNVTSRPHAGKIYTHTGTTLYFNSAVALSPKADVGVIILTNSANGGHLFHHANSIIEQLAISNGLSKEKQPVAKLGSKKRVDRSTSELDDYAGIYVTPGAYIDVYSKRKKLFMKLQGLRLELIPVGNNQFIPKVILLRFIPIRLGDQRIMFEDLEGYQLMTNIEEGSSKELIAIKLKPQPIPEPWTTSVGDYQLVNSLSGEIPYFEDFRITKENNLLVLSFKTVSEGQKIKMVLEFINEQRAKVAGLGRYAGQSVIYQNGIIKAFGYELKKISE